MDPVRRETDPGTTPEFVAVDIRGDADYSSEANEELMADASFPARAIDRERNGDAIPHSTGVAAAGVHEKQQQQQQQRQAVDGSPRLEHLQHHPSTPAAGGAKRRRAGRRGPAVWRDPRKIMFAFAALSSMGTLVLLYFTLSMGNKMSSGQTDG